MNTGEKINPSEIMINPYEFDKMTIKDYLKLLLKTLWIEEEQFSGKRPFGNGEWKGPIESALIKNNLVTGLLDEDGYIEEVNNTEVDNIILKIIKDL